MNVFELRQRLVDDYADYTQSFVVIRDERIRERVERELEQGLLWPPPIVQLNPAFEPGGTIDDLVREGLLHERCRQIFRRDKTAEDPAGEPLRRYRFTIAHVHGRFVCQCLEGRPAAAAPSDCRPVDLTEATDRALEREANVFAAELLMPEPTVRAAWRELAAQSHTHAEAVAACARRFDVSLTAMQWWMYAFRLVEERPI
ncbi:MAG TPA: ImmA/IrrE family metallo-endopeptidase [Gaiellaceae bacterium]|nr:ImmA/IrrE family metallo-endopeptidase [Gaiellaceae bacterium]